MDAFRRENVKGLSSFQVERKKEEDVEIRNKSCSLLAAHLEDIGRNL